MLEFEIHRAGVRRQYQCNTEAIKAGTLQEWTDDESSESKGSLQLVDSVILAATNLDETGALEKLEPSLMELNTHTHTQPRSWGSWGAIPGKVDWWRAQLLTHATKVRGEPDARWWSTRPAKWLPRPFCPQNLPRMSLGPTLTKTIQEKGILGNSSAWPSWHITKPPFQVRLQKVCHFTSKYFNIHLKFPFLNGGREQPSEELTMVNAWFSWAV